MALKDYIYNKPAIMTDRLLIRPMRAGDADALREWMPDPTIYKYWGKGPGRSEKDPALSEPEDLELRDRIRMMFGDKISLNL